MSLNANALTTVSRLQALGLTQGTSVLEDSINLISEFVEDYLGYSLGYETGLTLSLQGSGDQELLLPRAPIVAISSLSLSEADLTEDEDFSFPNDFRALGKIYREIGWPITTGLREDGEVNLQNVAFPIEIVYSAGYWLPNTIGTKPDSVSNLPERIKKAVDIACYFDLTNSSEGGVGLGYSTPEIKREKTAGGYEVEFSTSSKGESSESFWDEVFPEKTILYLKKYRRRQDWLL